MRRTNLSPLLMALPAIAALCLSAQAALAAPSFDCRKATTPVEKEICAKKRLGDIDRAMAKAYPNALARLGEDPNAVAAVKASQRLFLMTRNAEFVPHIGNDYDLEAHMAAQLELLRGVGPDPRTSLEGEWRTTEGSLFVGKAAASGLSPVNVKSRTHDSKHWACEFLGEGRVEGDILVVEGRDKYKSEYAGWRLRIARQGRLAAVETLRPEGARGGNAPFCGMNGTLAGAYFPADELPDNPCAGVPPGQCRE
jgi:uncharacterized protein YecT (DUF1311 family)